MKQSLGISLAAVALVGNTQAVTLERKSGGGSKSHIRNVELVDRDVFEENDNSNDFMAESIAEAEKEVKNGQEPNLGE